MITRLLPDQISKFWDIIKYAVEENLPPIVGDHKDRMNRVLSALLSGKLTCWASYRRENEEFIFEGFCMTSFIYDEVSDIKNILLYCVYSYNKTIEDTWIDSFIPIAKFAKANGCVNMVGYTDVPYLIEKANNLGSKNKTFVSMNLDKTVKLINDLRS